MSTQDAASRARARIHGLVNHGAAICDRFVQPGLSGVKCMRCGYEADVHLVRDLLADNARLREALRGLRRGACFCEAGIALLW